MQAIPKSWDSCVRFFCLWMTLATQMVSGLPEIIVEKFMPERNESVSYEFDPSLIFINVTGLSNLEFGLTGCSGARIILVQELDNFTNFLEISLGGADNSQTVISYCMNETLCEIMNISMTRPMYCWGNINFWLGFRPPSMAVGVKNRSSHLRLLTIWTPSLSDIDQLRFINYMAFTNEKDEMSFLLARDFDMNFCYIHENEEASLQQCGDNFFDKELCIAYECCYHKHRYPSCFYSKVYKTPQLDLYSRSIETLTNGSVLLVKTPTYVSENSSFLILIGKLWPNLSYIVEYEANTSASINNMFKWRFPLTYWMKTNLTTWRGEQSQLSIDGIYSTAHPIDYYGAALTHIFNDTGHYLVNFTISGQTRVLSETDTFKVQTPVYVTQRPRLTELINFTALLCNYPVFIEETSEFVYLFQNSFHEVIYTVDFNDGSEIQVFNVTAVKANFSHLPEWFFNSSNLSSSQIYTNVKDFMEEKHFHAHHLLFKHVYYEPGTYTVTINASGCVSLVNGHDHHSTVLQIYIQQRPKLKELVNQTLLVTSIPAYVEEPVSFMLLLNNNHHSLSAKVDFGDSCHSELLHLWQLTSMSECVSNEFLSKADEMISSDIQAFINSTFTLSCQEFNHTYHSTGSYSAVIEISGYPNIILKSDTIRLAITVDVKSRPMLAETVGRTIILSEQQVYVEKPMQFFVATEYFFPELTYILSFGDFSSHSLPKLNETTNRTIPNWVINKNFTSNFKNEFLQEVLLGVTNFSFNTVQHTYNRSGNYRAVFHINGNLEIIRKCDTVFVDVELTVQTRPSLFEIVKNHILMIAMNLVFTDQKVGIFVLVPHELCHLNYTLALDSVLPTKILAVQPLMKIPEWVKDGSNRATTRQYDLLSTKFGLFCAGITNHHFKVAGEHQITLTTSGEIELVGKLDSAEITLQIAVKSRPTLSQLSGHVVLLVHKPAFVAEETNCILIVEHYFPELQYEINITDNAYELVLGQADLIPNWIQEGNYYSTDINENRVDPSGLYMLETTVTFETSKSVEVYFNISGKLETVDRWENVTGSIMIHPVQIPELNDIFNNNWMIIDSSSQANSVIAMQILGISFLCRQHSHLADLSFTVNFGDGSPDEKISVSWDFVLPKWVVVDEPKETQKLQQAYVLKDYKQDEFSHYAGTNFYHMYTSSGKFELKVIAKLRQDWQITVRKEHIMSHYVLIDKIQVHDKTKDVCQYVSVQVNGGGTSADSPARFYRYQFISFQVTLHPECSAITEKEYIWQMQQDSGNLDNSDPTKIFLEKDLTEKHRLKLEPFSLHYGKYKITVKVGIPNFTSNLLNLIGETWILVEPSPMQVELLGGPVIVTDYFSSIRLKAIGYEDADEPQPSSSTDLSFTWFCTQQNEELPQQPLESRNSQRTSGCFGEGFKINQDMDSFQFQPNKTVYHSLPAIFIVHVYISKRNRIPVGNKQVVVILPIGPPSIQITCISNCGEYLNAGDHLVLNSTCLDCANVEKLDYFWEVEATCNGNTVRELEWKKHVSPQNAPNQLVVDPGIFPASPGKEQYKLKVTVTRQEQSKASAVFTVQTESQPQAVAGNVPLKNSGTFAVNAKAAAVMSSAGQKHHPLPSFSEFTLLLAILTIVPHLAEFYATSIMMVG